MNQPSHDLERLISRCLDDECTPAERRELNARLRRQPAAHALFEEHNAIDREVNYALRAALGRRLPYRRLPLWERAARAVVVAVAACLAVMLWFHPGDKAAPPGRQTPAQAQSWFATPPTFGDTLVEHPGPFNRPQIRVGRPDTDWIVIPSDKPGEFLVVEVNRVVTRSVPIQHDF